MQRLHRIGRVLAGLAALLAAQAHAVEPPGPRNRRVAVLPVLNFSVNAEGIWHSPNAAPPVEEALQRYLLKRLAVEPYLDVVPPEQVLARINGLGELHKGKLQLGLERMALGMAQYKALHVTNAIEHLERAQAALAEAYHDIVDPRTMANLALTLAQCYLEEDKLHETHVHLKDMFRREPSRRFKRGFYSAKFEQALRAAVTDFIATYPKENPLQTPARLDRFMRDIDVDALVFAYLEPSATGNQVRILVHDRHSRNVSLRSSFISTDQSADLDRIDRFVSRWITCLPPQIEGPKPPEKRISEFFLDTSFSYNVFGTLFGGQRLTSSPFHNLGMGVNAEWQFLSGLGTFLQVTMLISTQDPERDLTDSFPSLRLLLGMSYAYRGAWWRVFTRFGLESHFLLGDFTVTRDPWCKWQESHPECNLNFETTYSAQYMLGFHAALGAQFFVTRQIYLTTRAGVTAYIVPNDRVDLNFPIIAELGLGYNF